MAQSNSRSRIRASVLSLFGVIAMTALLLEAALRAAASAGVATPAERLTDDSSFYRDTDAAFGVWHPANARFRARADCFDVLYESNEFGARDRMRALESDEPRVVVLGDSFVEGIGVARGNRMTDVLEARSGVEHLNFGTAGNFSSIQEWKLYETLASRFDHEFVLIFTFPNNDFFENDPDRFWQPDRYRPYLRAAEGGYEVFYPIALAEAQRRSNAQLWWNRWYNAFYVYRLVAFLDSQIRVRLAQGETTPQGYIGYELFTEEDLERLFFSYRQIRDLAEAREVVIFTIPRLNDFLYLEAGSALDRLPRQLAAFAAEEERIRFVDLVLGFVEDREANSRSFADYFLPCDGHWNELGNQVAADIVLRSLSDLYPPASADREERL